MDFPPLIPGTFVCRDNRFRVQAEISGRTLAAHLANSGQLGELLVPGSRIWLAPADLQRNPQRRTAYDVLLVAHQGRLVSVDARLPGHLVADALRNGEISAFEGYSVIQREVRLGESRLDFRLTDKQKTQPCWIEAKSVTLVTDGTARFPDAPTLRGQRHMRELIKAVEGGDRAAVLFVIQRDDAKRFVPHDAADAGFGSVLRQAAQAGVEVLAWRCRISLQAIELLEQTPVLL